MSPSEVMSAYQSAAKRHDLNAVMHLIAADAVYLFSNRTSHFGSEAIRGAIGKNFESIKEENYEIHDLRWIVESGEIAVCIYGFAWTGKIDGKLVSGGGRGTNVLRRHSGEWRIVHEHLSGGALNG